MKKIYFALATISILFFSCAKETVYLDGNGGTTAPPTGGGNGGGGNGGGSNLLSGTSWKMVASSSLIEEAGKPNETRNDFAIMDACEQDDVYIYRANNTYALDTKALKCFASDPQVDEQGTWALSADGKVLTLTTNGSSPIGIVTFSVNILQLDATTLKTQYQYVVNGVKTTSTDTFTKAN